MFGSAAAGFHDQMFRLSDERSNVCILPTQKIHSLGPLSLNTFTEPLDTLKQQTNKHAIESQVLNFYDMTIIPSKVYPTW